MNRWKLWVLKGVCIGRYVLYQAGQIQGEKTAAGLSVTFFVKLARHAGLELGAVVPLHVWVCVCGTFLAFSF